VVAHKHTRDEWFNMYLVRVLHYKHTSYTLERSSISVEHCISSVLARWIRSESNMAKYLTI